MLLLTFTKRPQLILAFLRIWIGHRKISYFAYNLFVRFLKNVPHQRHSNSNRYFRTKIMQRTANQLIGSNGLTVNEYVAHAIVFNNFDNNMGQPNINSCRICLQDKSNLKSLFTTEIDDTPIATILDDFFDIKVRTPFSSRISCLTHTHAASLQVNFDDTFHGKIPHKICAECEIRLLQAVDLRSLARDSEERIAELKEKIAALECEVNPTFAICDDINLGAEYVIDIIDESLPILQSENKSIDGVILLSSEAESPQYYTEEYRLYEEILDYDSDPFRSNSRNSSADNIFSMKDLVIKEEPMPEVDEMTPVPIDIVRIPPKTAKITPVTVDIVRMPPKTVQNLLENGKSANVCSICYKVLRTRDCLNYHMKVHLNIRDYQCQYCDKAYVQESHLRRHMKHKHTGKRRNGKVSSKEDKEQTTVCGVCGKMVNNTNSLILHKKLNPECRFYTL